MRTERRWVPPLICAALGAFVYLCGGIATQVFQEGASHLVYGSDHWVFVRFQWCIYFAIFARLVLCHLESRWTFQVQTFALVLCYFIFYFDSNSLGSSFMMIGVSTILSTVLWLVPLERKSWLHWCIAFATLCLISLSFGLNQSPIKYVYFMTAPWLSFLILSVFKHQAKEPLSWSQIIRAITANVGIRGPVPVEQALKQDLTIQSMARGVVWVTLGLAVELTVCFLFTRLEYYRATYDPISSIVRGRLMLGCTLALAWWTVLFSQFFAWYYVCCGLGRLMGLPISAPIERPWSSVNFVEYWRRSNVFRYLLLYRVYFQPFAKLRGMGLPLSVFVIFLLSALEGSEPGQGQWHLIRWTIDGGATALTIWWLDHRRAKKIQTYIQTGAIGGSHGPRWLVKTMHFLCGLGILVAHGLLYQLEWPNFRWPH